MARPTKWRRVEFIPDVQYFAPEDKSCRNYEESIIQIEEIEAVRLKDFDGLEQEECAKKMEVSRQTFQRILNSARYKIADSLINGKAIRITGGNFTLNICPVRCLECGREWNESFEHYENSKYEISCPECNSNNIICTKNEMKKFCRRNCRRHGWRNE